MLASIIVPVYNVEDYLKKCIDSIKNQDISPDTYEIIAVNDGSTDKSLQVLEELQKNTPNLKIISQKNRGLSGARNTGFNNALGEYLICVDSDDYLIPNVLKKLVYDTKENDLDIYEFGANGVDENEQITYTHTKTSEGKIYNGENYLSSIVYMYSACNKVYKRSFLDENNLRFLEGVYIEDIEFNTRTVFKAKRIMATDFIAAHFLQRAGSITRSVNFDKKKKMIYDIHTVLSSIHNFTEDEVTPISVAYEPLKKRACTLVATLLLRVMKDSKSTQIKKEIISKLKQQQLYPTPYEAETKQKQQFLNFANNYILFSIGCFILNNYNKLKYGK